MSIKIIFIGGTGRCGTSILKEALALHPQAASLPFEHRLITDPDGLADFYASMCASWSPYLADRRIRRLERFLVGLAREPWHKRAATKVAKALRLTPPRYPGWELAEWLPGYAGRVTALIWRLTTFYFPARWPCAPPWQRQPQMIHCRMGQEDLAVTLRAFIEDIAGGLLEATGKQFFVEDNTWNVLFAREIMDMLPDAKIIHIYRDPRDVVASFTRQRWAPSNPLQAALWYDALMGRWQEVKRELPAHCYREVKLETFADAPVEALCRIYTFAGITVNVNAKANELVNSANAHIGRWQRDFTAAEQERVNSIVGPWVERLGYE